MKHPILTLLLAVALMVGGVSTARAEFRYGPSAGLTLSHYKFKQPELFPVGKQLGGVAGVQGELMFGGIGFGLDLGAYISMQGASVNLSRWPLWNQTYGKERSRLYCLDIPLNVRFKWTRMNGFEDTLAPFVFGGPVFSFNLAHNKLKAMDYSGGCIALQVGGGVELFRHWQVSAAYVWGMTYDVKMAKLLDDSAQSRFWTMRLSYLF